jgi:hypothetical protein
MKMIYFNAHKQIHVFGGNARRIEYKLTNTDNSLAASDPPPCTKDWPDTMGQEGLYRVNHCPPPAEGTYK